MTSHSANSVGSEELRDLTEPTGSFHDSSRRSVTCEKIRQHSRVENLSFQKVNNSCHFNKTLLGRGNKPENVSFPSFCTRGFNVITECEGPTTLARCCPRVTDRVAPCKSL